jgi:hypothetical protein
MITSGKMKGAGQVEWMETTGMYKNFLWESQKESTLKKDLHVDRMTVLRQIILKYDGMVYSGLIWLRTGTSGRILRTQE